MTASLNNRILAFWLKQRMDVHLNYVVGEEILGFAWITSNDILHNKYRDSFIANSWKTLDEDGVTTWMNRLVSKEEQEAIQLFLELTKGANQ